MIWASRDADLHALDLHPAVIDPTLRSMNFLNEVSHRFPDAVSFAAGRPTEDFYHVTDLHRYLDVFCSHLVDARRADTAQVRRTLFQYGRTKGIIHDLIAQQLGRDDGVDIDPEAVVMTVGCQEAMLLVLRALRADGRDVVLAVDPTYVGLRGAAALVDMPVHPVRDGPDGLDLDDLVDRIGGVRRAGLRPRALYVMPDFANPSGVSLSETTRRRLLDLAVEYDILLLEDNPYGLFGDDGDRPPSLRSMDTARRVVTLGSLAKTCLPGVRVGYLVADQIVAATDGSRHLFADELARIKSMVTVNTSPIAQAIVGGRLLEHGLSLAAATSRETALYRRNRRALLTGLAERFGTGPVTWNTPRGGYFVVLTVPFAADDAALERSAAEHGVLWTPMHHFYAAGGMNQIRLACGALSPAEIDRGLDRLAGFLDAMS
jgi:(S)-3,5-dihydroxyphenylglycine transaminase